MSVPRTEWGVDFLTSYQGKQKKNPNMLWAWGEPMVMPKVMAQGDAPSSSYPSLGWGEISSTLTIFSLLEVDASSTALFHRSFCFLLQLFQSSTRNYRYWLSGWSVLALQECITRLQTRWWSNWISILPPLWMRSVQDLQKQVPSAAKKSCWSSKWRTVTGLYSTFIYLFSNPLEIFLGMAPRSHSKPNPTTLETVLAQNNQIRIVQKGEVRRKQNTVLRFMS